jgi:hypothetical protein
MEINQNLTSQRMQHATIKALLIFSMAVLMLSLVSAGKESLGVFKQNENVRIVQVCDDATWVNISSISYPNGSVASSGIKMVPSSGEFYYNFSDTLQLGIYDVRGISDGCENTFTYYFEITPTGKITSSSQGLLSIGVLASIVLLMIFFGWLSFKFIEKDSTFAIGLFFLVMSLILSLYSLFLGYVLSRDYLFTSVSSVQEKVFLSALFGLTGIMFIGFVFLIVAVIKEALFKRTQQKYGEGYNQKTKTYDY